MGYYNSRKLFLNNKTDSMGQRKKLIIPQLVKKFPSFQATQMFITVFMQVCHLSQPPARSIQSTPSFHISLKIHFSSILPSTSVSFKSFLSFGVPDQNPTCISPLSLTSHTSCHLTLLDLITKIIFSEKYKSWAPRYAISSHTLHPLRAKYLPQHCTLEHPLPVFFLQWDKPRSTCI